MQTKNPILLARRFADLLEPIMKTAFTKAIEDKEIRIKAAILGEKIRAENGVKIYVLKAHHLMNLP